jgi:hypothetical protein
MSPDTQPFDNLFKPADPSQPPPFDQARYREELQDFTRFFERLATLDSRDWYSGSENIASDHTETNARQTEPSADEPSAGSGGRGAEPADAAETSEPDAAGLAVEPRSVGIVAAAAVDKQPEAPAAHAEESPTEPDSLAAGLIAPRAHRMNLFHSDLAAHEQGPLAAIPEAFPPLRGGIAQRSGWRRFMTRLQWALMILFGGTLLFAMGLGMGALVLSLPQGKGSLFSSKPAETNGSQVASPVHAENGASGTVIEPVVPKTETNAQPARPPKRTAKPAAAGAKAKTGQSVSMEPSVVQAGPNATTPAATPSAEPVSPAQAVSAPLSPGAPDAAPAEAAATSAPAANAAVAMDGPAFALQVGACGSYACVEQFRNLLLGEVESRQIAVMPAAAGTSLQRIRVEPLTREAAAQLKSRLAAKDSRFANAYVVTLP